MLQRLWISYWRFMLSTLILVMKATQINAKQMFIFDTCDIARINCVRRDYGCGMALHNYMIGCSDIMSGRTDTCSDLCKKSLIALTSTDEGKSLMTCDCRGDKYCQSTKEKVEVCRPDVIRANQNNSIVSCSVAQWICSADPLCSTALEYYHRFCKSMFHGRRCTMRCNNSISILNRQEKAAKLKTCLCDGTEDYNCQQIKNNMDRLCFGMHTKSLASIADTDNSVPNVLPNTDGDSRTSNSIRLCLSFWFVFLIVLNALVTSADWRTN